jgi:hypothetical protein
MNLNQIPAIRPGIKQSGSKRQTKSLTAEREAYSVPFAVTRGGVRDAFPPTILKLHHGAASMSNLMPCARGNSRE